MDISEVHPDLQPIIKNIPTLPFNKKWFFKTMRFLTSIGVSKTSCLDGVSFSDYELQGFKVRVYRPVGSTSGRGVFWLHGGGLLIGSPAQDNFICSRYAKELRAVVVSVDYRLAPENPWPIPLDDCYHAWRWFLSVAGKEGVDPSRILVAGQSAGGGLAAALTQRICDIDDLHPCGQLLFCPMLDDRTAAKETLDSVNHFVWNNQSNRAGWSAYLGQDCGLDETPEYAVPARKTNLSGLPPTWIGIGDIDLFYDESLDYANRLRAAGVHCEMDTVPKAPHGFEVFGAKLALTRDYFQRHFAFIDSLEALDNVSVMPTIKSQS